MVTGFPEQRLAYLADRIKTVDAHYCAVLKTRSFLLLGLVRFSDIAANPSGGTRIFADLMQPKPAHEVLDTDPVERVIDLVVNDPHVITVVKASGEFVGLITPDSFLRWLGSFAQPATLSLDKIPANSRWHPRGPSPGNTPPAFPPE